MIQRVLKTAGIVATAAFGVLVILGLAVSPREGPSQYLKREEDIFGVRVKINAWSGDAGRMATRDAVSAACGEVIAAAAMLDRRDPSSELSRACSAKGPVALSEECAGAVSAALAAARASSGAWDPTAAPLTRRYQAMIDHGGIAKLPDGDELVQWLASVGHKRAGLEGKVLTLEAGVELDLGDLGRGLAVDEAVEALRAAGVRHGIVTAGSQMRALGARHDSSSWVVGIESPRPERATGGFLGSIRIADAAVSTATDGGPRFTAGGESHSRVIDPRTGRPVPGAVASVTVIAGKCDRAAWLARALLVLGPIEGARMVETMAGVSALFVTMNEDGVAGFVTAGQFPTITRVGSRGGRQ